MKNTNINKIYNAANSADLLPLNFQSILVGIMLSDGSLYKSSPTSNTRFEMSFGEKYKDLAYHIGELFKDYMSSPVKSIEVKGINRDRRLQTID